MIINQILKLITDDVPQFRGMLRVNVPAASGGPEARRGSGAVAAQRGQRGGEGHAVEAPHMAHRAGRDSALTVTPE